MKAPSPPTQPGPLGARIGTSNGHRVSPTQLWSRLAGPGQAAFVAAALCLAAILASLPSLVRAILAPSAQAPAKVGASEAEAQKRSQTFEAQIAQLDGRSLFLIPGPPLAAVAPPPEEPKDNGPPPPPPKPTSYGGPSIIAMINGMVWFDDGKRLAEGGETKDDLRVLAIRTPWDAKVEWKGVEFDVKFISRDSVVIKEPKSN